MRLPLFLIALAVAAPAAAAYAAPAAAPAAPVAAPQPGEAEYTPEGAPRDDYNFTAWCRGVLEGHMALAEHVQTVLPLDEVQQKIGAAYLKGYDEALRIGEKNRSAAEVDAAQAIRYAARANWNTAMKADLQLGADTYLAWQLPGRCEHAAKRVAKRDDIFNLAPSTDDVEAMGSNMSANDAPVGRAPPPAAAMRAAPAPAPAMMTPAVAPVAVEAPADTPAAPAEQVSLDALTMGGGGNSPMADEAVPADTASDTAADAVMTADSPADPDAVAAPAEDATDMAAATPAPAAAPAAPASHPAAAATTTTTSDGKMVHMPRKGRLFPWGKRQ